MANGVKAAYSKGAIVPLEPLDIEDRRLYRYSSPRTSAAMMAALDAAGNPA